MLKYIYIRSLTKARSFFIMNIAGLSIAVSVFMTIVLYLQFETSYEDFVPEGSSIYRVTLERYIHNQLETRTAENYPGVGPAMLDLPGVISYARLYNLGYKNNVIITNEDRQPAVAIKQTKFLYADSAFLPMMGYKLIGGDIATALAKPNSAVITKELAGIYFGTQDPIGKTLHMHDDDENDEFVVVTGVLDRLPRNTHVKFDVLFSYKTLLSRTRKDRPNLPRILKERFEGWSRNDMYTYVQLRNDADVSQIESELPRLIALHSANDQAAGIRKVMHLQPLGDIHLHSNLAEEWELNADYGAIKLLGLIGIFVLVIGWINYVNLSTAKSLDRAKEVGVYKALGALRYQLIARFLAESAVVNAISIVISIAIVSSVLPAFNTLSGLNLVASDLTAGWFVVLCIALWLIGSCLSGLYPAIVLSSFKPAAVLKGKFQKSSHGVLLRKSLVVFQFTASVTLIAGTLIVFNQLQYMRQGDLGMNIDQVMVLPRPGIGTPRGNSGALDAFRNELKKSPSILAVTGSSTIPGMVREYKDNVKLFGASKEEEVPMRLNSMDYEFNEVFDMKILAGRVFSEAFPRDPDSAAVITASAAITLGFKDPDDAIGRAIALSDWGWNPVIIGVVNDYHQVSLKEILEPTVFYCDPVEGEYYSIRISGHNVADVVDEVRSGWEKAFPGNPFEYFFLDDFFNRQYNNEEKFGRLFTCFAALALTIGCIGLFGLSLYTTTQRTKEIGIRKVLGSSMLSIFSLLVGDYIKLIALSIVIGVPLVFFMMTNWLEGFAYHTTISGVVFVIAGTSVLLIAVLTVSVQIMKAARSNPVDALRYE
jgi:putative ABC transport system permease protein